MNKVFIIGLPRTGTTSVSVALLEHGFKVAHIGLTKRAFEVADVVSDVPCFCDYPQLDKIFPDAKFVYIDRPVESWVSSIQMLLTKMAPNLADKTGTFHPILKRCFKEIFGDLTADDLLDEARLRQCYFSHQQAVLSYFAGRDDLLTIKLNEPNSLRTLLQFIGVSDDKINLHGTKDFPVLNVGTHVASWGEYKHPNKVNTNLAGPEHRKFFDYQQLGLQV
ncbi:sulfotransferase family protein [uncultured Shewanella sp.]|uniref:sulfotransferase family protein n=1 Tax=uncultured Shewanella sp. TaxID=173975 RepID=UPI0026260CD3|nr:sulfotransferase family protein [uncultured Shewanella sp.]